MEPGSEEQSCREETQTYEPDFFDFFSFYLFDTLM